MPRLVIVKPLEQIDVTRMILNARKRLYESEQSVTQKNFGFGYYRKVASLEPKTVKGILCHKCRSTINLGESFAKKNMKGKPYHIACAKQLNLI